MKTTDTKKGTIKGRKNCAVSMQAYNDFASRIRSVLAANETACKEALQLLNMTVGYDVEQIDIEYCHAEAQIAFRMIEPEIEKAIRRSQAARERAAKRKKTTATEAVDSEIIMETTVDDKAAGNDEQPSAEVSAMTEATQQLPLDITSQLSLNERCKLMWRESRMHKKAYKRAKRDRHEKKTWC